MLIRNFELHPLGPVQGWKSHQQQTGLKRAAEKEAKNRKENVSWSEP